LSAVVGAPTGGDRTAFGLPVLNIDNSTPMAYILSMEFIETSVFTRQITELLSDESYKSLQAALMLHPESGDLVQGGGGIRKIRWGKEAQGKRGGIRVIYFYKNQANQIYFLVAYPKSTQADLTQEQKKILSRLVKEELK
jgi:hypothetical protein